MGSERAHTLPLAIKTKSQRSYLALGAGAGSRIRTRDILITNQALYQLSYTGARSHVASDNGRGNALPSFAQWQRAALPQSRSLPMA
jgi:hypothetical protein